jgi:APA family basic amino acid/polyamine antiporter
MSSVAPAQPRHHLLKILGVTFGVAVAVGNVIGSGILRSPSIIAGEVPGVALIIGLWVIGGVQAGLGANVIAELGAALPKSGGIYIYAQRALGDIGGLIVGWTVWASKLAGIAAASVSFAEFLPLIWSGAAAHKIAVAIAMQLALYAANIMGLREGRVLQEGTSLIKAAMLMLFICVAIAFVAPQEPHHALAASPAWGWANVILAYQLIRGAYSGWEAPVYFSGENVEPGKSIPRSLFYGLLLTATLYIGVNAALLYALGQGAVAASPLPFMTVLHGFGGAIPSVLFALTAMITVASCANANIMSAPRILFALAEDGLLPKVLTRINAGGSPAVAFLMTGLGSVLLALSGGFALVFGLIGTLDSLSGLLVDTSYFVLRSREPELPRPFRALWHPVLPALVLLTDGALLILFASADRVGGAVALGLCLLCIPLAMLARRGRIRLPE